MKDAGRYSILVFFLLILSGISDASELFEIQSKDVRVKTIHEPKDSSETETFYQKLQWDIGLGITTATATGLSLSTSFSYPINENIQLRASTGLVTLRGPSFAYRTEEYFNDGTGYGYEINEYVLGDYTALQSSLGLCITEPLLKVFSVSVAPYHLRLLRSTSIIADNETVRNSSYSRTGSNGESSDFVSAGGYNFGFPGITENDFGIQLGMGIAYKRFGFRMFKNIGLSDWGDDARFGTRKEKVSFNNFQFTYNIKK